MTALAKRLIEPAWNSHPAYVQTLGPEVANVCASAGFVPDPEQELALDLIFAVDERGKSAAFECDVIAARQQLKTGLILMCEIGWLYVTDERLVVHSAHELGTTEEAFVAMKALITDTPFLSRRLEPGPSNGIFEGNGRWQIKLATGQRLRYRARTKGGGRGLTGNKVVLDEAYALEPSHMGALLPTLTSVPDPQVLSASSAGKSESAVLRDKRDRGRAGLSPRQVYLEWGDPDAWTGCLRADCDHAKTAKGCALDDESRWVKVLTALGRRCTLETVRAQRQAMPPLEFAREFMVWWDPTEDGGSSAIDLGTWGMSVDPGSPKIKRACVAIAVAPGMASATVAVAGRHKGDDRTLVMVRHGAGTGWIPKALKKIGKRAEVVEVALATSDRAGALEVELGTKGSDYEALTSGDVAKACGWFVAAANDGEIAHVGQTELDQAIAKAHGTTTSEKFAAHPDVDITPATAAAIAAHRWAITDSTDYDIEDSFL